VGQGYTQCTTGPSWRGGKGRSFTIRRRRIRGD
jgi:hypothetical protein